MNPPWDEWAKKYGASVKATTPNPNIKKIEIAALALHIRPNSSIIEVGCGNGINLFTLYDSIPGLRIAGCDNSDKMLDAAAKEASLRRIPVELFRVDLAKKVTTYPKMPQFDYVICDRVLINIHQKQHRARAMERMEWLLKANGTLLMIENFTDTYAEQNRLRRLVGLKDRKWPPFNKFLNHIEISDIMEKHFTLLEETNISALHDLLLYVILPKIYPKHDHYGKWDYENPAMNLLTDIIVKENININTWCGQNSLMVWRKIK